MPLFRSLSNQLEERRKEALRTKMLKRAYAERSLKTQEAAEAKQRARAEARVRNGPRRFSSVDSMDRPPPLRLRNRQPTNPTPAAKPQKKKPLTSAFDYNSDSSLESQSAYFPPRKVSPEQGLRFGFARAAAKPKYGKTNAWARSDRAMPDIAVGPPSTGMTRSRSVRERGVASYKDRVSTYANEPWTASRRAAGRAGDQGNYSYGGEYGVVRAKGRTMREI